MPPDANYDESLRQYADRYVCAAKRGSNSHIKDFHVTESILDRPLNTLSGGERKKIMLALCLSSPAPVLLLDEPETSLDQDAVVKLGEYLEKLCERKTILVISHEKELAQLAKEVISITEDGCVREKEG